MTLLFIATNGHIDAMWTTHAAVSGCGSRDEGTVGGMSKHVGLQNDEANLIGNNPKVNDELGNLPYFSSVPSNVLRFPNPRQIARDFIPDNLNHSVAPFVRKDAPHAHNCSRLMRINDLIALILAVGHPWVS